MRQIEKLGAIPRQVGLIGWVIAVMFSGSANADVVYDWVPESLAGRNISPFSIGQLIFTDAAVASGSVDFSISCQIGCKNFTPQITGNPSGVVSIKTLSGIDAGQQFPNDPTTGLSGTFAYLNVDIAFNADGTLSGSFTDNTSSTDVNVDGTDFFWSGSLNSDALNCNLVAGYGCAVTGYWVAVPEIDSGMTFGTALAVLFGILGWSDDRRRRIKVST